MKRVRYPAQFKAEAVKQVTERGHGVVDVAKRLGMSDLRKLVRLFPERPSVYILHTRRFHSPSVEVNVAPSKAPPGSRTLRA